MPPLVDLNAVQHPAMSVLRPLAGPMSRLLKIGAINQIHHDVATSATPDTFFTRTLEVTNCRYEFSESDLQRIPESGPVVVVSNHPLGGLDGIVLGDLLRRRRADVKLMANFLLKKVRFADHHMIFVDPFAKSQPARHNIAPLRESLKHLKDGGLLGVFPGNRVSHYQWSRREIADPDWVPHIASLIRRSDATAVPIFIEGGNSLFFNIAGMIHPVLRTALLPREFVRRSKHPTPIRVHIGMPVTSTRLKKFASDDEMIQFLRLNTYVLKNRPVVVAGHRFEQSGIEGAITAPSKAADPIAPPVSPDDVEANLRRLPADACLLRQGDFDVYMGRFQELPEVMHEIGRGREISFRDAGGGTLRPLDLAPQDEYYHHLFLWHRKDRVIVGAYRLGLTDEILAQHGPSGLVCSGLFDLKPEFLDHLNPGLELGRSYILPEYQRNYNSLLLLWGGILSFIARRPEYNVIFGSVGVSQGDEYCPASRTLIVNYMRNKLAHPQFSVQVEARSPFKGIKLYGTDEEEISARLQSIEDVHALVASLESDGKGVPILIKHYVRMNARLLSFGVWTNHSNAVVSFMLTDLTTADTKFLRRYMGEEGYRNFISFHGLPANGQTNPARSTTPAKDQHVA